MLRTFQIILNNCLTQTVVAFGLELARLVVNPILIDNPTHPAAIGILTPMLNSAQRFVNHCAMKLTKNHPAFVLD